MTLYLGLGTMSGATFTENTDANYVRKAIATSVFTQGKILINTTTNFPPAAATYTVSGYALFDASTSGNNLLAWQSPTTTTVATGKAYRDVYGMEIRIYDVSAFPGASFMLTFPSGVIIGRARYSDNLIGEAVQVMSNVYTQNIVRYTPQTGAFAVTT